MHITFKNGASINVSKEVADKVINALQKGDTRLIVVSALTVNDFLGVINPAEIVTMANDPEPAVIKKSSWRFTKEVVVFICLEVMAFSAIYLFYKSSWGSASACVVAWVSTRFSPWASFR